MKTSLFTAAAAILLAGCANPVVFENMTEQELLAYNKDRPILEQIYCVKEARTSSRIRKTYCDTVEDWVLHNQREASRLDVLAVQGGSIFRSND